jgi:hypothetical protein
MRLPSYLLQNRYGVFYFRIVFPLEIRSYVHKHEFKRSLHTKNKCHAVHLSRIIKIKIDKIFRLVEKYKMDWHTTKKLLDKMATDLFAAYKEHLFVHGVYPDVVNDYPEFKAEEDADYFLELKHLSPEAAFDEGETEAELIDCYGEGSQPVRDILWKREKGGLLSKIDSVKRYSDKIISEHSLNVSEEEYEVFCLKVAEMLADLYFDRRELVKGLKDGSLQFDDHINDVRKTGDKKQKNTPLPSSEQGRPSVTFQELIDRFIQYKITKQEWSDITLRGKKQYLNSLHEILQFIKKSDTVYLDQLTADDAEKFEKILRTIPSNRKKIFKDHTIADLVRMERKGEIPAQQYISDKTYNDSCILLTSMMNFAAEPRQGFIPCHYFTDLKVKVRDAVKRESFKNHELELFFNTDLFSAKNFSMEFAWRYWIPILMVYHGTRLEEVAQPFISDILEEEGIWCLRIDKQQKPAENQKKIRVKNENSVRLIPLHQKVLGLGFLNYVEYLTSKGETKLFPDLSKLTPKGQNVKHGKKVTAFFNEDSERENKKSYLTKCHIKKDDTSAGTKSLICFRHTVQKVLNDHPSNIITEKIDQLFGHSNKSIGKKHYSGFSLGTIQEVVNLIDYPDANLPWDVDPEYSKIKFIWEK